MEQLTKLSGQKIFIITDFDGTIAAYRKDPRKVNLAKDMVEILYKITRQPDFKLAVVSGRGLKDLENMVAIKGIILAGCFGGLYRDERGKLSTWERAYEYFGPAEELYSFFSRNISLPEVLIEKKEIALTLHYKDLGLKKRREIFNIIEEAQEKNPAFDFHIGDKGTEIIPRGLGKGWFIKEMLSKYPGYFPVFLGNDWVDLEGIEVLKGRGLAFYVGDSPPPGSHGLLGLKEVKKLFKKLLALSQGVLSAS
ncbi:trehalose-phosphatase [Carboxydothermus pertinax]|uniref:Trehalose 6-phosphate phosphatase n=1 Tax=Carboxydothermus pertinax TaxID=870242 RepID=A0A1L8CSN9_9THEO|nr:trehalose-phosphatase [Carboxydothermus pertinax]GAV21907.1 trehalose-phosphatase [Carboxydothermus pertinax]